MRKIVNSVLLCIVILKKISARQLEDWVQILTGDSDFFLFPTLATNESYIFLYIISYVGRVFVVFLMFLIVV